MRLPEQDRRILRLAVPALAALLAEPLFLLVDSAVVGRLGTVPLAGLGVAGSVLATAVGVCVFLAYGTTAGVARRLGAGDRAGALSLGIDGMWLGLGLGVGLALAGWAAAGPLIDALGASPEVHPEAVTYLHWSLPGVPAMLVVLAATGVLRGLQDTRTPLVVAVGGAAANAVLNVTLVHGAGMGIAGSGLGTALAQVGMAGALVTVVVRGAQRDGAARRPDLAGIRLAGRTGVPLVVRTLTLRAALLLTTAVAARQGDSALAAHQVVFTLWAFAQFALDAVAIAAQAITGHSLGAGRVAEARSTTRRMIGWGVGSGIVLGLALLVLRPWLAAGLAPDEDVRAAVEGALAVVALSLPLAGWVFVLDGVLIGAGDGRYLAWAATATLAAYAPLALLVAAAGPGGTAGLVWLWVVFGFGFMGARAITLGLRARSDDWLTVG
ncbi:MAG: efflux family protein [Frankiales bacterium]|nr:efflux family protein [Frankiales bacterium]